MAGFENDVMVAKNVNFDEAAPKPHLGIINAAGKLPIGTGNTYPTPEILAGSLTSPDSSITVGYSSPNITLQVAGGFTTLKTLTFDSGGPISPAAGNITFTGHSDLNFVGNPGAHSAQAYNWTKFSPYVVGTNAVQYRFTSIQAAINQAVVDGAANLASFTVYVTPGTYTEDITAAGGVNIVGVPSDSYIIGTALTVKVVGTLTVSSLSYFNIQNISFEPGGIKDALTSTAGAAGSAILMNNVILNPSGSGLGINDANISAFYILNSYIKSYVSAAQANVYSSYISNSPTISAGGVMNAYYCEKLGSGTWTVNGTLNIYSSNVTGEMTIGAGIQVLMSNCDYNINGASTVINAGATLNLNNIVLRGAIAAPFTGTGALVSSQVSYVSGFVASTVTTQQAAAPLYAEGSQIVHVSNPAGDSSPDQLFDFFLGMDSSAPRTVTLPAAPNTGQMFVIKDTTGTAATNNVTVSGNGKNIDGSASYLITQNYGWVIIVYTGTEWKKISFTPTAQNVFTWIDKAVSATALANNGYFCTAALTLTLPASPSQGDVVAVNCDTAGAVVVDAPGTQLIRLGNTVTAAGGTATSTAIGDSLYLVYRATGTTWHAINSVGNWTVV